MDYREHIPRREFLRTLGHTAAGAALLSSAGAFAAGESAKVPDLVVVHGEDPTAITRKAVEALGGMSRFVSKGNVVVVKPNIGWARRPTQAANTSPEVVAAVVAMAFEAGAKEVKVFDNAVNNPQATYQTSGIQDAAKKAGATVKFCDPRFFKEMDIKGQSLKTWPVYTEAVECDCLINVPVAKHHSMSRLTLAMKNHMGIIGGDRGKWHASFNEWLCDFTAFIKPTVKLTVLDAYRVLVRNGPTGGSVKDVEPVHKVVAGIDQVAVDAFATSFFKTPQGAPIQPTEIGWLVKAKERGIGEIDVSKLTVQQLEA